MSKKEIEKHEKEINALFIWILLLTVGVVLNITMLWNNAYSPNVSQGEWQCTEWEDSPDYNNCKQVKYWNPDDEWTELTCKNKKVCTQEMLVRDVK